MEEEKTTSPSLQQAENESAGELEQQASVVEMQDNTYDNDSEKSNLIVAHGEGRKEETSETAIEPEPDTRAELGKNTATESGTAAEASRSLQSSSLSSSSLLSDQDLAVFGTLNTQLADALAEKIEAAISKGVDSLPLLDGDCYRSGTARQSTGSDGGNGSGHPKSPKERLWETLRYRFVRNVDVLEAYCAQHLLTLRKHPPARRKRIVAVLRYGPGALEPLSEAAASEDLPQEKYPSLSELSSEEERTKVSGDIARLEADIEKARSRRNELLAALESTRRAGDRVAGVAETIPGASLASVKQEVSGLVEGGRALGPLNDEARDLLGTLEGIKRDRSSQETNDSGDETFDFEQQDDPLFRGALVQKRRKALAPMEAYRRDKRELGLLTDSTNTGSNTGVDDGSAGINLLKSVRDRLVASRPLPTKPS